MDGIYTVRMTPTHRTLQASRATWEALATLLEQRERARNAARPNTAVPDRIRAALAATDDAIVRVTLPESAATVITGAVR